MADALRFETGDIKATDNGLVVGYANAPVVDRGDAQYRDFIPAELWLNALVLFFEKGAQINVMHRNIPGGETVSVDVTPNGPLLVTRPTKPWVAQAIADGDFRGYSIEYFIPKFRVIAPGTDEYRALLDDPTEMRAIRYAEAIDLLRVSYVDEPMNQGSYFLGGKALDLSQFQFRFDREKGEVVIFARTDEAMATLAGMLADEFKAAHPDVPVRGISFKFAKDDEPQHEADGRRDGLLGRLASALGKESTDQEEEVNGELKTLIDGVQAEVAGLKGQLAGFMPAADGAKAADLAEIKTAVDGLTEKFTALGDVAVLTAAVAEVATLKASVDGIKAAVESLGEKLDKVGAKSTVVPPTQTPQAKGGAGDPWGPGGNGASIYTKGKK